MASPCGTALGQGLGQGLQESPTRPRGLTVKGRPQLLPLLDALGRLSVPTSDQGIKLNEIFREDDRLLGPPPMRRPPSLRARAWLRRARD